MTTKTTFPTIADAIAYVETALGENAPDFDLETIAREVTEWKGGKLTLIADDDEFWGIVSKHDTYLRYNVVIGDDRENVDETYVDEYYDSLDEATARFEELKNGFDFGDHDELWLYENVGEGTWTSVDAYTADDRN